MPFLIRPFSRFPVQCSVTYNAGPFQGQGTVWNLSCTGWRLSGDLPMRPGETLSLTVTLPNEQRILVPRAIVRWSRGQEFPVENLAIEPRLLDAVRYELMDTLDSVRAEPADYRTPVGSNCTSAFPLPFHACLN